MSRSQLLPLGRYAEALQADSHLRTVLSQQAAPPSHRLRANTWLLCLAESAKILVTHLKFLLLVDAAQHNFEL